VGFYWLKSFSKFFFSSPQLAQKINLRSLRLTTPKKNFLKTLSFKKQVRPSHFTKKTSVFFVYATGLHLFLKATANKSPQLFAQIYTQHNLFFVNCYFAARPFGRAAA